MDSMNGKTQKIGAKYEFKPNGSLALKNRNYSNEFIRRCEKLFDKKMMPPLQSSTTTSVVTDSQGLIVPKKIGNPCLESMEKQNIHRELMFNKKLGKNVLNQKSELQRALQKQKERQFISERNLQEQNKPETANNELTRVIKQRIERLENLEHHKGQENEQLNPEYISARSKLRHTNDDK